LGAVPGRREREEKGAGRWRRFRLPGACDPGCEPRMGRPQVSSGVSDGRRGGRKRSIVCSPCLWKEEEGQGKGTSAGDAGSREGGVASREVYELAVSARSGAIECACGKRIKARSRWWWRKGEARADDPG
jgi:hypothetical protein